jgi:hypothetical protein
VASIDEALGLLEDTGPEFSGGLANHGPMAAEALLALGRNDVLIPWVEQYRRRLQEHPSERRPILREEWREVLGDPSRAGDWIAFFDRELAGAPWRDVTNTWVERLAPGIIAAATHGVIRTGHAARSLGAGETPARLHELAEGLGYWAARFEQLREAPARQTGLAPSGAIAFVKPVPADQQARRGLIMAGVRGLDAYEPFPGAIGLVDTTGDVSPFVSDLTQTFASVYLANAGGGRVIHFIHAVTGPSAVRLLAPYIEQDVARKALRYAWQAAAALYAAFGDERSASIEEPERDWDDIVDQAVATGDEHAIKFAEACLREYRLNPQPVYITAAADAAQRLSH